MENNTNNTNSNGPLTPPDDKQNAFWTTDVTTAHDRQNWFTMLSAPRRLMYVFLLVFVMCWCFLIGFSTVEAMQPDWDEYIFVTKEDLMEEPPVETVELSGTKVILVVGCDMREGETTARSDTIMLFFLNMDTNKISVLSIPRDSYVTIPGVGNNKVNAAFNNGGIGLTISTLENLTGLTIDNYVIVDFQGFSALVDDVMGGVEIYVDSRMYKPEEDIDLQVGLQKLDGYNALAYVRYRDYTDGDFTRIDHQQNFMSEMASQLMSSITVSKVPELASIFMKYATTDLSLTEAVQLGIYAMKMDYNNVQMYTAEGYCMWLKYGGLWQSFVILEGQPLYEDLRAIVGEEADFTTNVIDDGGQGYYSIPSGENSGEDHSTDYTPVTDPVTTDPNAGQPTVDPGVTDPGVSDPTVTDPSQTPEGEGDGEEGGSVWDVPSPNN